MPGTPAWPPIRSAHLGRTPQPSKASFRDTAFVIKEATGHFDLAYRINVMGLCGRSLARRAIQLSPQAPGAGPIVAFVPSHYLGPDNHPHNVRGPHDANAHTGSLAWAHRPRAW